MVEISCSAWWFQICNFLILIAPPQLLSLRNLKLLLQALLPWRSTPLLSYGILVPGLTSLRIERSLFVQDWILDTPLRALLVSLI